MHNQNKVSMEEVEETINEAEEKLKDVEWNRKIDIIYLHEGKMKIICKDNTEYIGICIGDCLGTDKNGEDVDGIRFELDSGEEIDFIDDDIKSVEFLN